MRVLQAVIYLHVHQKLPSLLYIFTHPESQLECLFGTTNFSNTQTFGNKKTGVLGHNSLDSRVQALIGLLLQAGLPLLSTSQRRARALDC